MPRLSDKVLTDRLRASEEQGLVRRTAVSGDRSYVVCELTEPGDSLRPRFGRPLRLGRGGGAGSRRETGVVRKSRFALRSNLRVTPRTISVSLPR